MIALETIFAQPIVRRLGWALLHFVWQGAAVALLLAAAMRALRRSTANSRYVVACAVMLMMILLPVITMLRTDAPAPIMSAEKPKAVAPGSPPSPPAVPPPSRGRVQSQPQQEVPIASFVVTPASQPWRPWKERLSGFLERCLPWVVCGWLSGVFVLSLRLLGGWAQTQRLKRRLVKPVAEQWQQTLGNLSMRMRFGRPVQLLESGLAQVPTVIGWLKPVILLPASAMSGLTSDQLEALLAHELAHIRRHDYLVNLLQSVVERLLFYHPGVWWVSHRIRAERENCCDDLAVVVCGNELAYARALTEMEGLRGATRAPATAAGGGSLLNRIRRLAGRSSRESNLSGWWLAGLAIAAVAAFVAVACLKGQEAHLDKNGAKRADAFTATLSSGIKVELIGVSRSPSKGKAWWRPHGPFLQEAPYDEMLGRVRGKEAEMTREFAVRVTNLPPEEAGTKWRIAEAKASATGLAIRHGQPIKELHAIAANFSGKLEATTVCFGVAAGEWKTLAQRAAKTGQETQGGAWGTVAFAEPYVVQWAEGDDPGNAELKTETRITVAFKLRDADQNVRVVAVNPAGNVYRCSRSEFASLDADTTLLTAAFSGPQLDRIAQFRFQARPYQWAEFKNVALRPSEGASVPEAGEARGWAGKASKAREKPATVSGIVTDESGKPLSGATWWISAFEEWRDGRWQTVFRTGVPRKQTTDETGRFEVTFHEKLRYDLQFDKWEYAPSFLFQISADSPELHVKMKKGVLVKGRVEIEGKEHPDFEGISVVLRVPNDRGLCFKRTTLVDHEGKFRFYAGPPPTPPGAYCKWQLVCAGEIVTLDVQEDKPVEEVIFRIGPTWKRIFESGELSSIGREIEVASPSENETEGADWRKKFDAVYRLDESEILRHIPKPFIPERAEFFALQRRLHPDPFRRPGAEPPPDPDNNVFLWDANQAKDYWANPRTLEDLLRACGLSPEEIRGPDDLLWMEFPGDWLLREGTPVEKRLEALAQIFRERFGRSVRFEKHAVEEDVIVVRGKLDIKPVKATEWEKQTSEVFPSLPEPAHRPIHVYVDSLNTGEFRVLCADTDLKGLLRELTKRLRRKVIDETQSSEVLVGWSLHDTFRREYIEEDPSRLDRLLENLEKQTSLEFRKEKRPVEVWFVHDLP